MEIKVQKCQSCSSRSLRNILVRDHGQKVFVQCRDCGNLVARYELSKGGYFHVGKGFESFLRSVERDGEFESARDLNAKYEATDSAVSNEFAALSKKLTEIFGETLP
ncbi:hypothetical protein [Teredinibacter turnerae]|uniref:Uncharacterized protein n=1 Tax=Teredinibacter turnerae (strain ATCC 39867 / T7901) TaxID=377629 RepID=C5BU42_TERTT|nr:hypothetical protein [Teredinibacter turnerae]ACR14104.1 hypothetical protein TERTU_1700 [Teredinibacter turnerae T7901]